MGKIPWRRTWQPTPAFLPGEFHGQRSLAGYSPQSHKESDTTERLSTLHSLCGNSPLETYVPKGNSFCSLMDKTPLRLTGLVVQLVSVFVCVCPHRFCAKSKKYTSP